MPSKKYNMTFHGVMSWATKELEQVGNLVGVEDPDIQYAYAQSVVNSMAHLRDALVQMIADPKYRNQREDLMKTRDKVSRVIQHVIKDFDVQMEEIQQFNTHHVLGNLSYLKRKTRKQTRKQSRKQSGGTHCTKISDWTNNPLAESGRCDVTKGAHTWELCPTSINDNTTYIFKCEKCDQITLRTMDEIEAGWTW